MRPFLAFIGIVVVIVLLVTSNVIGGAFCIRGLGCLYSADNGLKLDRSDLGEIKIIPAK